MTKLRTALIATTITILTASGAAAQSANADLYTCIFGNTAGKILPDKVLIAHSDETDKFFVSEGIMQYYQEVSTMEAKLSRNTNKVLALSWKYFIKDSRGKQATLTYYLNFQKGSKKATLRTRVPGYKNNDNVSGTCGIRRGKM